MDLYLKEWRIAKGLTRTDLARRSGVSRQTLIHIEDRDTVRPHRRTLQTLARMLQVEVGNLYERPGPDVQPIQGRRR